MGQSLSFPFSLHLYPLSSPTRMLLPHFRCSSAPRFSWPHSPISLSFSLLLRKTAMSVRQRIGDAEGKPVLRGVVFDMDGTLIVPAIDFSARYREVLGDEGYAVARSGNPGGSVDILHHIETWAPQEQQRAYEIIADFERQGLDRLQIMPGFILHQNSCESRSAGEEECSGRRGPSNLRPPFDWMTIWKLV